MATIRPQYGREPDYGRKNVAITYEQRLVIIVGKHLSNFIGIILLFKLIGPIILADRSIYQIK